MESIKLTVLCAPLSAVGHMNAFRGLAAAIRNRGHRVVFAVDISWKGKLVIDGFEEEIYEEMFFDENKNDADPAAQWSTMAKRAIQTAKLPKLEAFEKMLEDFKPLFKNFHNIDPQMKLILDRVKPDVIITEILSVVLVTSNIPFISLISANPLSLPDEDGLAPPFCSGFSSEDKDKWDEFRGKLAGILREGHKEINEELKANGAPAITPPMYMSTSKHLNLYLYPEELDYTDIRPLGSNYFRMDATIRDDDSEFKIPKWLLDLPGKLIYLSMGSMGSSDLELMTRLIGILSKSNNKFVVSKGPSHDKYDLPANMWGEKFLPQIKVLQKVDLFITHGGNNSVTEALYFGKPLIVLPLFGDQHDNGVRVAEKGLGYSFNPFHVTDDELLPAIEKLLGDYSLKTRLKMMSYRMKNSKSVDDAVKRIEKVVKDANKF